MSEEIPGSGTRIYISPAPGARPTAEIGGIVDAGEYGVERKAISATTLADDWASSLKGLKSAGSFDLSLHWQPGDLGQRYLQLAAYSDAPYNFAIEYPDGAQTRDEFAALVTAFRHAPGKIDGVAPAKASLLIQGGVDESRSPLGAPAGAGGSLWIAHRALGQVLVLDGDGTFSSVTRGPTGLTIVHEGPGVFTATQTPDGILYSIG